MRLLREFNVLTYEKGIVKESKEKGIPIVVKAIMQRADAKNQNGRVYPRPILEREINNYQKAIAEGRATGELDHPESSIVSLQNVSHVIREIGWIGDDVVGKLEILNTPKGKIAQDLMESGIKLGISSRCVGEVQRNENGEDVVDESLQLIAFDLVSEPSTHNAWLTEAKEISTEEFRKMVSKVDRVNRLVNEILKRK